MTAPTFPFQLQIGPGGRIAVEKIEDRGSPFPTKISFRLKDGDRILCVLEVEAKAGQLPAGYGLWLEAKVQALT